MTLQGRKALGATEIGQTWSFRGSKSRNKVSVGEPAEGSLQIHHVSSYETTLKCSPVAVTLLLLLSQDDGCFITVTGLLNQCFLVAQLYLVCISQDEDEKLVQLITMDL